MISWTTSFSERSLSGVAIQVRLIVAEQPAGQEPNEDRRDQGLGRVFADRLLYVGYHILDFMRTHVVGCGRKLVGGGVNRIMHSLAAGQTIRFFVNRGSGVFQADGSRAATFVHLVGGPPSQI